MDEYMAAVVRHYDLLVTQNNDPVYDPEPLKAYMDRWDGPAFIGRMNLRKEASVLEVGVGTGRLAVRVAPLCGAFYGIDASPATIRRAGEHLRRHSNVTLLCGDFLRFDFTRTFDVIYSSLTFMHFEDKRAAINRVAALLRNGGRFVLSIDQNQEPFIDFGAYRLRVFPDDAETLTGLISESEMSVIERYETAAAHVFVCLKA